jgi:hypothetical protein
VIRGAFGVDPGLTAGFGCGDLHQTHSRLW